MNDGRVVVSRSVYQGHTRVRCLMFLDIQPFVKIMDGFDFKNDTWVPIAPFSRVNSSQRHELEPDLGVQRAYQESPNAYARNNGFNEQANESETRPSSHLLLDVGFDGCGETNRSRS